MGRRGDGIARAIHDYSSRASKPFVVIDCAAIPPNLAEAELFGHERGAFTGALKRKESPFVDADGGTVLLDEVGDLSLDVQAKLLRVVEEQEVKSVGQNRYRKVDVRIVSATLHNLAVEAPTDRIPEQSSASARMPGELASARPSAPALRDAVRSPSTTPWASTRTASTTAFPSATSLPRSPAKPAPATPGRPPSGGSPNRLTLWRVNSRVSRSPFRKTSAPRQPPRPMLRSQLPRRHHRPRVSSTSTARMPTHRLGVAGSRRPVSWVASRSQVCVRGSCSLPRRVRRGRTRRRTEPSSRKGCASTLLAAAARSIRACSTTSIATM